MVSKAILDRAKAFVCWDALQQTSIQLVELRGSSAYFYPPSSEKCSIVVFHEGAGADCTNPLLFLFHETGHCIQFHRMKEQGDDKRFYAMMNISSGDERISFERESWQLGRTLLQRFMEEQDLDDSLLSAYDRLAAESIQTYS